MTREMSALPEPVKAFNDELAEMLTQKPPVSSSKMKDITRCAMRAQKYYKHIVMSVEKLIQKCKPEYKLSGIYVVDAIVRQSRHQNKERDVYAGRFESNLHITATHLFKASKSDQVKICRTFKLWELNKVFSYHSIQKCLNNANPDARKEGITLAENSIAKMSVKPVVTSDIVKQQKELEEQRRKIQEQQEELKRKQDALLKQNSSAIPPILGNLLHFGQASENTVPDDNNRASETANKVKSLLDDFDYSDEDEIKQPGKKGTPKSRNTSTPSISTPKKPENLSTPSPVTTATHNTSIYEPDPPKEIPKPEKYDTRNLEKLYTPSPIEKTSKRSKHKSPERTKKSHKTDRSRDSDKSRDTRDRSRDKSRDRSRDKASRRKSSPEAKRKSSGGRGAGKRSRSTSPDHYSKKRDRISKPDCVSVLSTTIWIGNLRKTVTKEDISSLMKKYTDSCSIDMVPPRGCSYINLGDREAAENVLKELKDLKLHGAPCKVAWAPGKGCKEYKEHWNIEKGVTYIPNKTFEKLKISGLEEGGVISESTLPHGFKLQDKRDEELSAVRRRSAPLMSLSLPSNISVFSSIRPDTYDPPSDEEMTDVFPPIPILPVPTVPEPVPLVVPGGFPVPGMNPLAPSAIPGHPWMPPPRPAPPTGFQAPGMAPPFPLPPPHQIPLPTMNMPPVATPNLPNLNQIPMPGPQIPMPGPQIPMHAAQLPLPGPPMGMPGTAPNSAPLFRFRRSPSPPSPRTLARNMRETDSDSESEHNKFNRADSPGMRLYAGSLPPFSNPAASSPNIYLTGGGLNPNSPLQDAAPGARLHAGSLPPFNSRVHISRTLPSPTGTRPGEPRFVNSMRPTSPAQPRFSAPRGPGPKPLFISGPNENMRGQNEGMRGQHEGMRGQNEGMRGQNESMRGQNESSRGLNEGMRGQNEGMRGLNEGMRGLNEGMRGQHESIRGLNEGMRGQNESMRGQNESSRGLNEDMRGQNESIREQDESSREQHESIRGQNESIRGQNESIREQDESSREQHESSRGQNEGMRGLNEGMRGQNESIREQDESSREQHESMRGQNESIRSARPRPLSGSGDAQSFPGPDQDNDNFNDNQPFSRPSFEEMRGPGQPRPNFAPLDNMFNSDMAGNGNYPRPFFRGGPRPQFGRPPPPQFNGNRGGLRGVGRPPPRGAGRPPFNGPRQRNAFRMTFRPLGNNRPPFGN